MPGDIPNWFEGMQRVNREFIDYRMSCEDLLYDWLDCDFDNISDIEELKHRTREILRGPAE